MNQLFSILRWEVFPDMTNIIEIVECPSARFGYMSRHIPFLEADTGATSASPTLMLLIDILASCWRLPINRNSVLSSFSYNMSSFIQARTSRIQFSSADTASSYQMVWIRGGSRIFFRRGCTRLLLYFNTNKPHSFFCRILVVLENRRSCQGWGGGVRTPLHPPPRSAPVIDIYSCASSA